MVDAKIVHKQLRKLKFGASPWNQAELRELPHILHEHEQILQCVNGFYEGGVALLVATDMRLLLIDKKPLNYLTVEDLRFDMINEIDYAHRLLGATIIISTGSKTLKFKSYNQPRLRELINLIQERMSMMKKEQSDKAENQQQHLEEINKQLQMYLLAQHQQLQIQINGQQQQPQTPQMDLPKPTAELSDYLFAQRLLEKFQQENGKQPQATPETAAPLSAPVSIPQTTPPPVPEPTPITQEELVADAKREVFGQRKKQTTAQTALHAAQSEPGQGIEINPIRIAYSKLPMMLRSRRFGRPPIRAQTAQPEV